MEQEEEANIFDDVIYADPGRRSRCRPKGGVISGVCTSSGGSSPGGYNLGCNLRGLISRGLSPAFVTSTQANRIVHPRINIADQLRETMKPRLAQIISMSLVVYGSVEHFPRRTRYWVVEESAECRSAWRVQCGKTAYHSIGAYVPVTHVESKCEYGYIIARTQ